jgi:hypothetical protein
VSLGIDIKALSDRVDAELLAAHDYYQHSRLIWRLPRLEATHGAVFVFQNPTTGTIVDPTQLVTLSVHYESVRLAESVLQHFVALFEDFVFELLRLWLSSYPGGIPNKDKKQVTERCIEK